MNVKSFSLFLTLIFFLFHTLPVFAEPQTFIQEYTYEAGEMDSKVSSRAIALEQVKRLLLEELGTYLESETVVKDYRLDQDKITSLTAGIVQTTILEEKWNGRTYWLKAKIVADPDEVAVSMDRLRNNRQMAGELAQARQEAVEALEEVELLKEELVQVSADQEKQKQYDEAVNQLIATDWFEKGHAYNMAGQYQEAARAYEKVIVLKPNDAKAYSNRGVVYIRLGNYQQAVRDLDRAVVLDPQSEKNDDYRKIAYKMQKNPNQLTPREKAFLETSERNRPQELKREQEIERQSLKKREEKRVKGKLKKKRQQEQLKNKKKIEKKNKKQELRHKKEEDQRSKT